jgi:hypothetical protein
VIFLTYHVYLYSINCPTVICLPSMCYLSYGETPLVNCAPWSYFHHIAITYLLYSHCLLYSHTIITFHSIRSYPFVSSKPVRLITSSQVGNKVFGCVCAGSTLLLAEDESTSIVKWRPCWSVIKPVRITFSCLSALLLTDIPCFLTEGKDLPLCSSYFPLGVSQLPGHNNNQLHASHQVARATP